MAWESIIEHYHNERVLCDVNNAYSAIFTGWLRDTLVERRSFNRRTFSVLRSTCGWRVTTYVSKPSAVGQPTRPTQPFILMGR